MSFIYDPKKMLNKIAPEKKIKKLVSKNAGLKKTALSFVDDIDFISKKSVTDIALKTLKGYKKRIKADPDEKKELTKDPRQLINRVQNEVLFQISNEIKDKYKGEYYVWLPSDAEEPDPEHQLNYGKTFKIGEGEMPGERYGCRCGMEILTEDKQLEL